MAEPKWNQPALYGGYLKNIQNYYEREPIIQASLQIILSVFAVAFFIFFAIRPTLGTITTLLRRIEDQKIVDGKLDIKIQQLIQAEENLSTYGQELTGLLSLAIPQRPEVERITKELEAISIESQAYIISLSVQESPLVGQEQRGNDAQFVTFGIIVGGTQQQIQRFMEILENMQRSVLVTRVAISRAETGFRNNFPLVADTKATIYYLPQDQ